MRNKYNVQITDEERSALLRILVDRKNELMAEGIYTDLIDEIMIKIFDAGKKFSIFGR